MTNTVDAIEHEEDEPISTSRIKYDDVDLSEYSDEELIYFGLSQEEIDAVREESSEESEEESEEEESDEEEEVEEETEEEEELEEEKPKKEPRIPKSRFDEAVQREREKAAKAEERATVLEEQITRLIALQEKASKASEKPAEPEYDLDAAEEKYAELLIEGEIQEAAKLRKEMERVREKRLQDLLLKVKEDVKNTTRELSNAEKKTLVIKDAIEKYPFLDDKSEDFDEELVKEINFIAAGYEARDKVPSYEAMEKAINRVLKRTNTNVEKPKTGPVKKKKPEFKTQPPVASSAKTVQSTSEDTIDWENMSQSEFAVLYKKHPQLVRDALNKTHI